MSLLLLLFAVSFVGFFGISNEIPVDLDSCVDREVTCKCGKNPDTLTWNVPFCPTIDNSSTNYLIYGEFPDFQEYCEKFQNCRRCYQNGLPRCRSCPIDRSGRFCEEKCTCENGGRCYRNIRKCRCPEEFEGENCELRKTCDCKNGGSCTSEGKCICPDEFEGRKCEGRKNTDDAYCGIVPGIRYENGTKTGKWPWQAALFYRYEDENDTDYEYVCGGSLLNNLWVITGPDCLTSFNGTYGGVPKEMMRVFLGKYYNDISKDDDYVQEREVDEYYIHPDYSGITGDADIALIKLKTPVEMNNRVQPVCLPSLRTSEDNIVNGSKGMVTGWTMNKDRDVTETLEEAVVPVIAGMYFKLEALAYNDIENMFCTAMSVPFTPVSYYIQTGDPIYFRDAFAKETRWVLEGIVSFQYDVETDDGSIIDVAAYTRVSKFLDWIQFYIKNH